MSTDATDTTVDRPPVDTPHEKPTGSEAAEFGPDEVFHLLQNQRRRRVLRCLREVDGTVDMSDVAEQVAAWEHDTTVEALTSAQRQRVYIALYQRHLPKLDDFDVIDYNQSRGLVTPRARAEWISDYLDLPTDDGAVESVAGDRRSRARPGDDPNETGSDSRTDVAAGTGVDRDTAADGRDRTGRDPWAASAVATSVAAAVLLLAWMDVAPFAGLSELGVAAATVTALLFLSIGGLRA
jgi:hypothetical protein